jgi:hypothetical protein
MVPLHYSGFRIHVDAPALGFAGLSCLMILSGTRRQSVGMRPLTWMAVAGVLATLAVFSKQTLAPVLPALVVYVCVSQGLHAGVRFAAVLAVVLGFFTGLFGWAFGFRELAFHAFVVPGSHPLVAPSHRVIGALIRACLPFASVPIALWIAEARLTSRPPGIGISRSRWPSEPWFLFGLVALSCVPTAMLGYAKQGGAANHWSLPQYFLLLACLSVIRPILHAGGTSARVAYAQSFLLSTTLFLAIYAAMIDIPLAAQKKISPNRTGAVFDYCRKNPGQVYFAWHPAAVLVAEGKLYHFYYALFDRDLAGYPITPDHFAAHVPAHATMVMVEDPLNEEFLERTFEGYHRRTEEPALPTPLDGMILERNAVGVRQ